MYNSALKVPIEVVKVAIDMFAKSRRWRNTRKWGPWYVHRIGIFQIAVIRDLANIHVIAIDVDHEYIRPNGEVPLRYL